MQAEKVVIYTETTNCMFMSYLRFAFILSLALMIFAGCSKEEIQPDPLNAVDNSALKKTKGKKNHLVPFKASFDLTAHFDYFGPLYKIDEEADWPAFTKPGGMHVIIKGDGRATHLGRTDLEIIQWWTRWHPDPPPAVTGFFSYGQGSITFTAANGDELYATYWGWADHQDDPPTEILTHGTFTGGTGRFEDVKGTFLWDGLFVGKFKPLPTDPPAPGTAFGNGEVTVTGSISY
jgi:hypothetical protein